jgi:hypothetical protein
MRPAGFTRQGHGDYDDNTSTVLATRDKNFPTPVEGKEQEVTHAVVLGKYKRRAIRRQQSALLSLIVAADSKGFHRPKL